MEIKRIKIAGVPLDAVTYDTALERVRFFIESKTKGFITTPNPEIIVLANQNPSYLQTLQSSALAIPDGIGVLWAPTYLSLPFRRLRIHRYFELIFSLIRAFLSPAYCRIILPERVTGTDLFYQVVEASRKYHWRIFLLGARPGVAEKAIHHLLKSYPDAQFVGAYAGSPADAEASEICERINQARPDILFVAYGNPAQELWIHQYLNKLDTVYVAAGIGGAFDFAAGSVKRAPRSMQAFGLEWLWRLLKDPRRFRRIWRATVVFVRLVFRSKYPGI
ncbi:acetylglucosaminyldiphospho-UDP acetyl-beta-D-mannosaminyltransferase [Candidatus Peregrinibacteria bacterium CG_4_10_14_0_2_um_filter_43_11]|nr:MAG: acetylglucosaminyldiphospho-UDP acetyl-beta-D-mannosaminyltransferase [Candidatus Peregrinibacteria bacterium CG_4_10_14_0_2_um_filter_43_11]